MAFAAVKNLIRRLTGWWSKINSGLMYGAKYAAKRAIIIVGLLIVTLWISVLLYASFYHIYVPSVSIIRPAHFKFRVCPNGSGMCSFPMANVTLVTGQRAEALGKGQQYRVILELQLPDSVENRDVGMFMVMCRMYDEYGLIAQESSRAVTLKYQSDLLKTIQTFVLAPLYITGWFSGFAEQAQTVKIELYEDYWDDYYQPAVGVLLEIHSRQLTFYSAQLQFHACYSGLRYYLFYYPLISACCGILFNCMWLAMVFTLTWYRLGLELLEGPQTRAITVGGGLHGTAQLEGAGERRLAGMGRPCEERGALTDSFGEETGALMERTTLMERAGEERDDKSDLDSDEEEGEAGITWKGYIQPFTMSPVTAVKSETVPANPRIQPFTVAVLAKQTKTDDDCLTAEDIRKDTEMGGLRHRVKVDAAS